MAPRRADVEAGATLTLDPQTVDALTEELLAGFSSFERSKARPLDEETLRWVGVSKAEAYRCIERGEIVVERAAVPPRRNGRRGASKIFVTLAALARFRAARMTATTSTTPVLLRAAR